MAECMEEKNGCTVIKQYYGCCGGNGNSGTGAENDYSTEETVCGKWIDGKPIYRKVITGTLAKDSGNAYVFANVSELNIGRMIKLYGNMIDNADVMHITLQTSYNMTTGLIAALNMAYNSKTGNILYNLLNNDGYYSGCTVYVVIEYTKK